MPPSILQQRDAGSCSLAGAKTRALRSKLPSKRVVERPRLSRRMVSSCAPFRFTLTAAACINLHLNLGVHINTLLAALEAGCVSVNHPSWSVLRCCDAALAAGLVRLVCVAMVKYLASCGSTYSHSSLEICHVNPHAAISTCGGQTQ